jgi:hypothetical protein
LPNLITIQLGFLPYFPMEERQVEMWNDMENNGRKISWIVKWFGKYRKKWWNDRGNMEEK